MAKIFGIVITRAKEEKTADKEKPKKIPKGTRYESSSPEAVKLLKNLPPGTSLQIHKLGSGGGYKDAIKIEDIEDPENAGLEEWLKENLGPGDYNVLIRGSRGPADNAIIYVRIAGERKKQFARDGELQDKLRELEDRFQRKSEWMELAKVAFANFDKVIQFFRSSESDKLVSLIQPLIQSAVKNNSMDSKMVELLMNMPEKQLSMLRNMMEMIPQGQPPVTSSEGDLLSGIFKLLTGGKAESQSTQPQRPQLEGPAQSESTQTSKAAPSNEVIKKLMLDNIIMTRFREALGNRAEPMQVADLFLRGFDFIKAYRLNELAPQIAPYLDDPLRAYDAIAPSLPEFQGAEGQEYRERIREALIGFLGEQGEQGA